jgi:predicted dienelactone hydrolase
MQMSGNNKGINKLTGKSTSLLCVVSAVLLGISSFAVLAQQKLYDDNVHHEMMPELSTTGELKVGVRTIDIANENHVDPFTQQVAPRKLKLEVWYPSADKSLKTSSYENELRSGIKFSIHADATRDVKINASEEWPLVVLSHGYTGYRTIMYYLGEHLASHGYVVVGIDHTDSTNEEIDIVNGPFAGFMSTLINRSRDQQVVLDFFGDSANVKTVFGDSVTWTAKTAGVIGYSMGGYGAINTVGACYDFPSALLAGFIQSDNEAQIKGMQAALNTCSAGQYPTAMTGKEIKTDPRWKAMMAFAPWGGQHKLFSHDSLAKVTVPSMLISGDLLTFLNARHNIAPHPAPKEAWTAEIDYGHYLEPAWSQQQLNYINEHFSLAMMDCHLKSDASACEYLDLSGNSNQVNPEGGLSEPWKGFDNRYSTGMEFRKGSAN